MGVSKCKLLKMVDVIENSGKINRYFKVYKCKFRLSFVGYIIGRCDFYFFYVFFVFCFYEFFKFIRFELFN